MMNILIPTEPDDTHALLVKLALEKQGHHVTLIFTADQPTRQKNSVFVDISHYRWQSTDRHHMILDNNYDIVWWRRPRKPYIPKGIAHPDDYNFVIRENTLFYESFTHNLAPDAWWINTKESANRANFKLLQLKIASECDMRIPTTLCSNDPNEIRTFLLKHQIDGVIYKSLCANAWFEEDQVKLNYTSRVRFLDLPHNQSLQRTPGIFQKEMKKNYELRVTCFGHYMVAVKIDTQHHSPKNIDWRAMHEDLHIELYTLPLDVQSKIRHFMQELGIVFGSFDFIVTTEGEYVFLEVNEQGQFLWIEEYNPEIPMLDIFVQFLLHKSIHFTWKESKHMHTLTQYKSHIEPLITEHRQRHVDRNCSQLYKEECLNFAVT